MEENFNVSIPKMYSDEYIAIVANKVRDVLELKCPYSPEEAVRKLDGEIQETIEDEYIDAEIKKYGDDKFIIRLNKDKPENRKTFTVAHELGHLFLHMGFIIDQDRWNSIDNYQDSAFYRMSGDNGMPGRYKQEEHEANVFAANFLMPEEEFISVANQYLDNGRCNTESLANHFNVSEMAVINRGKWLRVFEW